jgi:hypothetical protein
MFLLNDMIVMYSFQNRALDRGKFFNVCEDATLNEPTVGIIS